MVRAAPCTSSALTSVGRLVGAVSFGWQAAGGRRLPGVAAARARATALATDLGLDVAGQPDVRAEPDDTGWAILWPRVADGIPVPGDGVRIDLWPDGRVHAVVRTERPLAVRPARVIDEASGPGTGGRHPGRPVREPLRAGRDLGGRARLDRPQRRVRAHGAGRPRRHAPARLGRRSPHTGRSERRAPGSEALPGRRLGRTPGGRRPPVIADPPLRAHVPRPVLGRAGHPSRPGRRRRAPARRRGVDRSRDRRRLRLALAQPATGASCPDGRARRRRPASPARAGAPPPHHGR